jgi:hypothetical protein
MTEFLLVGTRPAVTGEVTPHRAARDLADLAAWHRWLRRWGLLRSFGVPALSQDLRDRAERRVCLIVQASGYAAAQRLAANWGRMGGYDVAVLELRQAAGAGR